MDFGLQLAGLPTRDLLEAARRAEEEGFAAVYVPDHFANEPPGSGRLDDQVPMWEALSILGALAASTSRVRLGGHVLCNLFRHPALTAQAIATLDNVSEGRAVLGIGAGWTKNEFEMTGVAFPEVGTRLRMLDESVRIIKSLWTENRTSFDGEFYRLREAFLPAKPVQRPHPPVLFGGSGKGLLRIAAREADVVNVIVDTGRAGTVLPSEIAKLTEDGFRAKLDFVRKEARAHGREPALSTTIFVLAITSSAAEADQIRAGMAAGFGLDPKVVRGMPIALVGTADDCADELRRREREWGVSHLIVSAASGLPTIERFAGEVLPKL